MKALRRKVNSTVFQIKRKKPTFRLFVFLCISYLAFVEIRTFYQRNHVIHVDTCSRTVTSQTDREDLERAKLILVYTPWDEPWAPYPREVPGYKLTDWDGTPCEESRCQITYDRNLLNISDAVLVHIVPGNPRNLQMKTRNRPPQQRWVVYGKESPATWNNVKESWNGLFNWTATYRRDSDFFVPYGSYVPLEDQDDKADSSHSITDFNFAQGKDKMAVFGASNHFKTLRFPFMRALVKHISIDFYGKCAELFNQTWKCRHNLKDGCLEELQRYKFYLAFENSFCTDYITEKYWRNSLERGLVPVVLGGASYDPELVIPGSFINAADFDSVKALADYLIYLDKNDTAYNQYFQWRSKYKVVKYQFWLCRLCKALHDPTERVKVHHNLSDFWSVEKTCTSSVPHILDMINRG